MPSLIGLTGNIATGKSEVGRMLAARGARVIDADKVARYDGIKITALLSDPGIVRNQLKIGSAVTNAQAFLKIQEERGSFSDYIWRFTDGVPIQNAFTTLAEIPAKTPLAETISKDLKTRGFKFVGPTIVYAHMQATGMVNDHLVGCFRHREVAALSKGAPGDRP